MSLGNIDHEAGIHKLSDLRKAWVKFTRPAVSTAVTEMLRNVTVGLAIPDKALDLAALQEMMDKCKPDKKPRPSASIACPVTTMKPVTTPAQAPIKESQLAQLVLSSSALRSMLPKTMNNKQQSAMVTKVQGLARFLLHPGTATGHV